MSQDLSIVDPNDALESCMLTSEDECPYCSCSDRGFEKQGCHFTCHNCGMQGGCGD